ncbi:MAG: RNA polymerase sigma-E factor [Alphaproteobacteria bacterium ADurb.BinA280]|jgi:RNA polymerase sigma-70 factor, ECF subfamily|nr:MAG: RNA polymerase sigma-E factor [Alphaproteobacteria bacterium ADurb.BinA280]
MLCSATISDDFSIGQPVPMSDADEREWVAALDAFLRQVERRALRMAELSCGHREDALDIVQDAMMSFARRYGRHPQAEWPPLFHRVLDNRILDHHRRQTVRGRWLSWLRPQDDEDDVDPMANVADCHEPGPLRRMADEGMLDTLQAALRTLPHRQRQCFLLRIWEGLDVADTARAMDCSEGSVKTHLSRALARLREPLEPWQ